MKAKHVFAITGLSLAMAATVLAGRAFATKDVRETSAAPVSTIYCKNVQSWWKADGAAVGAYCWNSEDDSQKNAAWPGVRMTAVGGQTDLWTYTVPNGYDKVIFTRVNGSGDIADWGAQTSNLDIPSVKNCFTITSESAHWGGGNPVEGNWSVYPVVAPEYHLLGTVNSWNDSSNNYLFTVDAQDSNHYTLTDVELAANAEIKVCDTKNDDWFDNGNGNVVVAEAGTYDIGFYVSVTFGDRIVLNKQEPAPEPEHIYKYSINGGAAVTMSRRDETTEYVSAEVTFNKGDVLTFLKDDVAYPVTPKEDGEFTKVYSLTTGVEFAEGYVGKIYLETATAQLWAGQFTPGYYLVGEFCDWNAKLGLAATLQGGEGPAYVVEDVVLEANDEIKFAQFPVEGNVLSWKNADADKVHTESEVEYEVVTTGEGAGNLNVVNAGTYDIYYNPESGWYSIEDKNYTPDIPANEGYYICGLNGWRYENATAMTLTSEGGNVAYKMDLTVAVDDEIRVRSYFDAQDPKDRWAEVGNVGEQAVDFGEKVGNNFKFTKAGHYDIYAKYEGEPAVFKFYVAEHVDSYEIQLTAMKFNGKSADGSQALASRTAYAGTKFVPSASDLALEGYVAMGIFKDETLETAYPEDGEVFSAPGHLYVKYEKVGLYIVGDAAFSGGEGVAWDVEGATLLPAAVNDTENNLYEGAIVIPASASSAAVSVRPAFFTAEGTLDYNVDYSIAEYSFAKKIGDNIQFTKGGTFAVYVNKSYVVYLNEGLDAFNTKFLTDMEAVCTAVIGGTKDLDDIKAKWAEEKIAYQALSSEEKATVVAVGFDGGNEKGDDLHKVIAKYAYIVTKYGTDNCEDFIWGQTYDAQSRALDINIVNNSSMLFVVIGTISLVALASVIVLKKKKANR